MYQYDSPERLRYENAFAVLVGLGATMGGLEWMESEFEINVQTEAGRVKVGTGTVGVNGPGLSGDGRLEAYAVRIPGSQVTTRKKARRKVLL